MADNIREKAIHTENRLKDKLYSRMPDYIFSNDLFENRIKEVLNIESVWIDAGCGNNSLVKEFEEIAPKGTGIDEVIHPELVTSSDHFINTTLENIPFGDSSVDLITANMVVEHIVNIKLVLKEFHRVLKPGGRFIFRTTNRFYPTLFIGNLLPKKVKDFIIYRIFGVRSHDIFVTTYPANTLSDIEKLFNRSGFEIEELTAVEDIHMFNPLVFNVSYMIYRVQRLNSFKWLRNCIVCSVVKK